MSEVLFSPSSDLDLLSQPQSSPVPPAEYDRHSLSSNPPVILAPIAAVSISAPMNISPSPSPPLVKPSPSGYHQGLSSPNSNLSSSSSSNSHSASPSSSASSASATSSATAAAAAATAALYAELPDFKELPPIKLATTRETRSLYDNLSDLYSLLVTTEHVEKAYVKDSISNKDYTASCGKLIAQYKTLKDSLVNEVPDLESFCREYGLNVKAAENRFKVGVPATILHGDVGKTSSGKELTVFHAVQHFITAMDSLKLNMKAVDELHPNLTDLMDSINKVPNLPVDHEAKTKVREWLVQLSGMKAHEELTDEQIRQMSFDLDSAYNGFHKFVQGK